MFPYFDMKITAHPSGDGDKKAIPAIMGSKGPIMTDETHQPFLPGFGLAPRRPRATGLPKHKAFLALKPDDCAAERISEVTLRLMQENGLAGRPLKHKNLHISLPLVWEGAEFRPDLPEIVSARVQMVRVPPFEIILDMAMSFRQPKRHILVLGATRSVANIYNLNRQLVFAMGSRARKIAFTPHMTLLYTNKPVDKQPVEPVRWMAREFVLVHSFVGLGRHETVARWPLR